MTELPTPIHLELRQSRPFGSAAEAAGIGLLRTAEVIRRALDQALSAQDLSLSLYNVLRILRGAHPDPLPTLEIATRTIERTPGVTRMLDRLEARGLVVRRRCERDRRQVHCWISEQGLALLGSLDEPLRRVLDEGFAPLGEGATAELGSVLDRVRHGFRQR